MRDRLCVKSAESSEIALHFRLRLRPPRRALNPAYIRSAEHPPPLIAGFNQHVDFSLSRIVKRALSGTKARAVSMLVRSRGGREEEGGGGEKKGRRGEVVAAARREKGRRRRGGSRGFHLRKLRRNLPVVRKSVLIKAVSSEIPLSRPGPPVPSLPPPSPPLPSASAFK